MLANFAASTLGILPHFRSSISISFGPTLHNRSLSFSTTVRSSRSRYVKFRKRPDKSLKYRMDNLRQLIKLRILRHKAPDLNLYMDSDGYVRVRDLLSLNIETSPNVPLSSHTINDIKEVINRDKYKQKFSLIEENGELLIRANEDHTVEVETEGILTPILSPQEYPVCVHGTYKKNLKIILENGLKRVQSLHVRFSCELPTKGKVISGMNTNINILIFLDIQKAIEDGMKFYITEKRVILTEGFDGIVPVKYFEKIKLWPDRKLIPIAPLLKF